MRLRQCPNEAAVLEAVRTGRWQEEIRSHAGSCSVCGELLAVSSWLNRLAKETASDEPLPDPTQIWWKARIVKNLQKHAEADQQAARPLVWIQLLTLATVFSGGLFWWLSRGLSLQRSIASLWSSFSEGGVVLGLSPSWAMALALGLALPLLTFLASLGLLWRED